MEINLSITEKKFIESVMSTARDNGIACQLVLKKPELLEKQLVFDTNSSHDHIMAKLNSSYYTMTGSDNKPTFDDFFEFITESHVDALGWLPLCKSADSVQDGRWYMKVYWDNCNIEVYRRNGTSLDLICIICTTSWNKPATSTRAVVIHKDKNDKGKCFTRLADSAISDESHKWNNLLGDAGLLAQEALSDAVAEYLRIKAVSAITKI